jgi:hypothetical protein
MNQAIAANRADHPRPLAASPTPRLDNYRLLITAEPQAAGSAPDVDPDEAIHIALDA